VKNTVGAKVRKKQKQNIICCVYFQSNSLLLTLETHNRQIYINKWE